jgi:hypothetical protein
MALSVLSLVMSLISPLRGETQLGRSLHDGYLGRTFAVTTSLQPHVTSCDLRALGAHFRRGNRDRFAGGWPSCTAMQDSNA